MAPTVDKAEAEAKRLGKQALKQTIVNALAALLAYTVVRAILAAGFGAGITVLAQKLFG